MGRIAERFAEAFRNFVTDGVPSSGVNHPSKSEIRAIGTEIEQTLATTGLGAIYDTTSAGITATTNGQLFLVRGSNGSFADLYKNVSGVAVSQNVSLPSTASVNIRPQSAAIQGNQILFDPDDIVGGGRNMSYWPLNPRIYDTVMGGDLATSGGILNPECVELLGYCKIPVSPSGEAWATVLDMDTRLITAMLFTDATALMNSKPGRVKLFIDKWGDTLNTTLDIVHLDQAVGANMFGNGRTMDGWDAIPVPINAGDGYVPTAGGYLTGLGFQRSWRSGIVGGEVLMGWRSRQVRMRGESGFVRMYAGLDAIQNLSGATMKVHLFGDSGAFITTQDIRCERKLSDYEWVFAGRFEIPVATREIRVGFGAGVTGSARAALTGEQIHVGPKRIYTILRDDYPVCTASRRFAYPPYMFLTKGRPMPLYLPQIAQRKTDALDLVGSFWAGGGSSDTLPYELEGDRVMIEPSKILSTTGGIDLHPFDNPVRRLRMPLTLNVGAFFGTGTVRPHFIGDSLTNREQPVRAAKKLEALGYTVANVGTMINNGGVNGSTPLYPGEGREGIQWADYIYELTTYAAPVTDWAAYLAGNDEYKRVRNPYLFAATGSAPYVNNGFEFNFRKYLDRGTFPDPTHVLVNLGRNEITLQTPEVALAQMLRGLTVVYASIRAACPNAQIGFIFGGEGRSKGADTDWDTDRWPMLLSLLQFVKAKRDGGDSKVWVVPAYAHMTGETGWGVNVDSTDAETGMQTLSVSDSTHMDPLPNDIARSQYAEVTSAFIHATTTQPSDGVLTGREMAVSFGGAAGSGVLWTNQPAAATFLLGSTRHITRLDLRRFKQVRLTANKQNGAGTAGAKLALRCNPANNYTLANFATIGTSVVEVPVDGAAQIVTSGWIDLAPAAKGVDMLVGIVGYGGSGSVSPEFGAIIAEFR